MRGAEVFVTIELEAMLGDELSDTVSVTVPPRPGADERSSGASQGVRCWGSGGCWWDEFGGGEPASRGMDRGGPLR